MDRKTTDQSWGELAAAMSLSYRIPPVGCRPLAGSSGSSGSVARTGMVISHPRLLLPSADADRDLALRLVGLLLLLIGHNL